MLKTNYSRWPSFQETQKWNLFITEYASWSLQSELCKKNNKEQQQKIILYEKRSGTKARRRLHSANPQSVLNKLDQQSASCAAVNLPPHMAGSLAHNNMHDPGRKAPWKENWS